MSGILFALLFSWNLLAATPAGCGGKKLPRFEDYPAAAAHERHLMNKPKTKGKQVEQSRVPKPARTSARACEKLILKWLWFFPDMERKLSYQ